MIRNPRQPEKPPEPTIARYNFQQEHSEPFTKEKVEELYSKANRNTPRKCFSLKLWATLLGSFECKVAMLLR
jgi:hypothetical protein